MLNDKLNDICSWHVRSVIINKHIQYNLMKELLFSMIEKRG